MWNRLFKWALIMPFIIWNSCFLFYPCIFSLKLLFARTDTSGAIISGYTSAHLQALFSWTFFSVFCKTLLYVFITSITAVAIALIVGFFLLFVGDQAYRMLLIGIVIVSQISFLVRVFSVKMILHPSMMLTKLGILSGLLGEHSSLLYSWVSVFIISIYIAISFVAVPIFLAVSTIDLSIIEASVDLGSTWSQTFWYIYLPSMKESAIIAYKLSIVTILGAFIIVDIAGGIDQIVLASTVMDALYTGRNLSFGILSSYCIAFTGLILQLLPSLYDFIVKKLKRKEGRLL